MRKVLPISLAVLLIVVGAVYVIAWFGQASAAKKNIEQTIARLNAGQQYVTYESIQTSGFPRDVVVSLVKPHFTGRVDTLFKSMFPAATAAAPAQPNPFANLPEWNEDVLLDGHIDFSINALSSLYGLRVSGNWKQSGTVNGQTIAMSTQSAGDLICLLRTEHPGGIFGQLWDFKAITNDPQVFANDFRLFDCSNPGYTVVNSATQEKLMNSGPGRMYISSTPQGTQRDIRIFVKATDSEITPAGDKIIATYAAALSQDAPIQYSVYGKQNVEIDFSYSGPVDMNADFKHSPLSVNLSKFDFTNQVYTMNGTFTVNNAPAAANSLSRLNFRMEENFSAQYDAIFQDVIHRIVKQMYASQNLGTPASQEVLKKYTPDELYAVIHPAVPDLHGLGKMVQNLDVSFQGDMDAHTGDITLSALELSATPYGITGKGAAKAVATSPVPAANITLSCSNCLQLIDDSFAYAARVQKVMTTLSPDKPAMSVNPQLAVGIKGFLSALVGPSKASNPVFDFAIISDAAGITINGKRLDEVMGLYKEYIIPAMHPAQ